MFSLLLIYINKNFYFTAKNKKDAKKAAAKAALLALYNLTYPEDVAKQENVVVG